MNSINAGQIMTENKQKFDQKKFIENIIGCKSDLSLEESIGVLEEIKVISLF
jgi:hypothetical protein